MRRSAQISAGLGISLLGLLLVGCGEAPSGYAAAAEACELHGELSCPRPIFNVGNLQAGQAYYRDVLGFSVDWVHGDPPTFGSVSRGKATLFMCEGCQGAPGAWMMVFADDVDELHEEFSGRGASIRMEPTNMPWGLRELHVADPDGNVIRFGMGPRGLN